MRLYQRVRKNIQKLIDVNPAYITVTRKAGIDDGAGGYVFTETTLASIKVRLFNRSVMTISSTDGGKLDITKAKLMCDWCANLRRYTSTNEDTFVLNGEKFRVLDVKDYRVDNFTVKKEAEVELID